MNDDLEKRVYHLELTMAQLERLEEKRGLQIDALITQVDRLVSRFDSLIDRMDSSEKKIEAMQSDVWNSRLVTKVAVWLAGTVVAGAVLTVFAVLAGTSQ